MAALARESASGAGDAGSVVFLTGRAASERAVKVAAPGKRILHFATHGFFLGGDCAAADTRGRGFSGLAVPGRDRALALENPLVFSGLAFAGANHRDRRPEVDDGLLTAAEVVTLDLRSVEWAVLSACETGLGEVRSGEGVMGLRRAFRIAGARTLIMSLWPVSDTSTRLWMEALYHARFTGGASTAEAVRAACRAGLESRRANGLGGHPFYWAAFVAAGDWN